MNNLTLLLAALCLTIALAPLPSHARGTGPGQETIWDQIMSAQAARDLQTGAGYMDSREYEKAIQEFTKAVLSRPNDPAPHLMLGSAYYWSGQVERAEAEFEQAIRLDPKNAQGHLLMGIVLAWKGDVPAAYRSFQEAERVDPNRSDVQMNLGSIEETLGLYPQALDHFRRAASLEPKSPLYHFQLGMLYRRLGRDSDAIDSFRQALKYYPEFEDACLELGAALERQGDAREAADWFRKAVRIKSRDSVARLRLGRVYLKDGKPQDARDAFRDAFHLTPEEPGGGLALSVSFGGQPHAASGAPQPDKAQPAGASAAAPQEPPAKDPLDVLARNLDRVPLNQEAKLEVEMAFLPRPKLEPARPTDRPSALKRALEEAGRQPPRPIGVRREFNLPPADAKRRREQIQRALDDLREVLRQAPPDAETRMAMNLSFPRAAPGAGLGEPERQPKASYQPRQVGNDLGLWVIGTGWMALVEEVLPQPGEAAGHSNEPGWWVVDGLGYAVLGNARMALDAFERALELDPKDELAHLGRAVAFVEMGREEEAIAAYRKLLELHPGNRAAKDGLAWLLRAPASP